MPRTPLNTVDSHVGARIRLRRLVIGMSQERLGELLKVSFQQVQRYENGSNRISAGRIFEIAHVLDVPLSYFFEDVAKKGRKPARESSAVGAEGISEVLEFVTSPEGLALNRSFARIKEPRKRKHILDLARDLASEDE